MILNSQAGKKIGILGLGRTGESVFTALNNIAQEIICSDDSELTKANFATKYNAVIADISDPRWLGLDRIIVSPGIANSHKIFSFARDNNIEISSDIGLFLEENPNSRIVAVTGTNGKSTTVSLIGHILEQNNINHKIGGNIGLPVLNLPANAEIYVLELSSFQLDLLNNFNPDISVLLNITPDHLDRYDSYETYCKSKFRAFEGDGIKIIGIESEKSREFFFHLKSLGDRKIIPISSNSNRYGISCTPYNLKDNFYNKRKFDLPPLENLLGDHNRENIAAAFAVCRALGLTSKQIIDRLSSFQNLPHRMQYLGKKNNIKYYNDSKATNIASAYCSLSSLSDIFWLVGGIFKEESLESLNTILGNIKKAYLFGESKMIFGDYLKNKVEYEIFSTMQEAFIKAESEANSLGKEANILLAPACSSLDQFKNYVDRGEQFIGLYNAK